MDLRFYDYEFNLKKIVPKYISANWTIYYNDVGTAEFHFSPFDPIVPVLMENPYLVVVQGDLQAIITGKRVTQEDVAVYGRTVNWILSRRVVPAFNAQDLLDAGEISRMDAAQITSYVVRTAFDDIENFSAETTVEFDLMEGFSRENPDQADAVVKECLRECDGGHRVVYDTMNHQWRYEVLKGEGRQLILSETLKNAYDTQYDEDLQQYYSAGWYEKESEPTQGEDRPDPVWTRIEGDSTKTGIYKWETILSGTAQSEARAALTEKKWMKSGAASTRNLIYGKDYALGDSVLVLQAIGGTKINTQSRVIGVQFWNDEEGSGERPIFEEE